MAEPPGLRIPADAVARYHRGMKIPRIAFAAACLLLLAACGNKGPLFMPQKQAPVVETLPPPPEPTEAVPAQPEPDPDPATGGGDGTPR